MAIDPLNSDNLPKAPLRDGEQKPPVLLNNNGNYENQNNMLLQRLSMKKWDVDPVKIYTQLTKKEPVIDEYSRLVSDPG